jgi:two-component system, OmpR family, KDP operon response regulator KdpE
MTINGFVQIALYCVVVLQDIWGSDAHVQYLRIYIGTLRRKIEEDPERPIHILTVTGVGYRLREPDQ